MARPPVDDDDDLPWLAEGVREAPATMVPRARLLGGALVAILLAALVAIGVYLVSGHKSDGSGGFARPEDAPLITADAGPYKVSPTDPGGAQITGIDDSVATVAGGADTGSALAPDAAEEPLARPTAGAPVAPPGTALDATPSAPATPPPTDLLPKTIPPAPVTAPIAPPPVRTIAPAPVVAPAAAPRIVAPAKSAPVSLKAARLDTAATSDAARDAAKPAAPKPDALKPAKPKPHDTDPLAAVGRGLDTPAIDAPPRPKPASPVTGGGVTLQLGAFSTRDKAEAAWTTAGGDGALSGLAKRIEPVDRDGTTLYRLRAGGVASKDAARALCGRVKAAGNACIVAE